MRTIIREEAPGDEAAIRIVNERAFEGDAEANLVDTLRSNTAFALSLVAILDDRIVGHILFTPATIESEKNRVKAVGLAPMAVLPEHQRKGIGTQLAKIGIDECRKAGHEIIIVLGHPEYYPRFGFEPSAKYGIRSEYEVPTEVFMVMELKEGALKGVTGTAKYRPEFMEV